MTNRFIKHNMLLLIVSGIASLVVMGLLVYSLIEYVQMVATGREIDALRNHIKELIDKRPAPVEDNKPRIAQDAALYRKVGGEIRRHFGFPYQPAVDAFLKELKFVPERDEDGKLKEQEPLTQESFMAKFKEGWDSIEPHQYAQQNYYVDSTFRPLFQNWTKAAQTFRKLAQPYCFEEINRDNLDEVILYAIGGIPRRLNGQSARMQLIYDDFRSKLTGELENSFMIGAGAQTFGFNTLEAKTFAVDDYPFILEHFDIINDMLRRLKGCVVPHANGEIKENERMVLHGVRIRVQGQESGSDNNNDGNAANKPGVFSSSIEDSGAFNLYHYTIELTGSMEQIRRIASELAKGYADRRFYVVRSIALYAEENGAESIFAPLIEETATDENQQNSEPQPALVGRRRRRRGVVARQIQEEQNAEAEKLKRKREEEERRFQEIQAKLPFNERVGYGQIVVGQNHRFRAVVDVDYVVLKRQ